MGSSSSHEVNAGRWIDESSGGIGGQRDALGGAVDLPISSKRRAVVIGSDKGSGREGDRDMEREARVDHMLQSTLLVPVNLCRGWLPEVCT